MSIINRKAASSAMQDRSLIYAVASSMGAYGVDRSGAGEKFSSPAISVGIGTVYRVRRTPDRSRLILTHSTAGIRQYPWSNSIGFGPEDKSIGSAVVTDVDFIEERGAMVTSTVGKTTGSSYFPVSYKYDRSSGIYQQNVVPAWYTEINSEFAPYNGFAVSAVGDYAYVTGNQGSGYNVNQQILKHGANNYISRTWQIETGKPYTGIVARCTAISPLVGSMTRVVAVGDTTSVHLFKMVDSTVTDMLGSVALTNVNDVVFDKRGNLIVAHEGSARVSIFKVGNSGFEGAALVNTVSPSIGPAKSIAYSRSLDQIAVGHASAPYIAIFSLDAGGLKANLANPIANPGSPVVGLTYI